MDDYNVYLVSFLFGLGPMEYWRGKRFWLFTKKEEQGNQQEAIPNINSFRHGIWRSGIVGRRRR